MQKKSIRTALSTACALIAVLALTGGPAQADDAAPRVDLRVLVVTDGGPAVDAIAAELDTAGTPYTKVDLQQPGRPVINAGFLADTVEGRPRAKFQAVVLPNDNPFSTGSPEMAALATYERTYGIPQVDAYTYARPAVGLQSAVGNGYAGSMDGVEAQVTTAGRAGPFGYLDGAVPFEDNSSSVGESYAYVSPPTAGADFTSYVDAAIPGRSTRGSLVGEYRHDGRRELVVTFVYNRYQQQFRLLARGIVEWMTGGVHLGASRNYFAVHVDDVLAADARWDTDLNCTPDVDCGQGQGMPNPIRMTAADADYAATWQNNRNLTLDLAYNAEGSADHRLANNGVDLLADKLIADRNRFRWINHTYTHAFLGCQQDVSVVPWRCDTLPDGSTKWVSRSEISYEIATNRVWGQSAGLPLENDELITGEHSGMRLLPQQPTDNPNLAPTLADNGVSWLASDNSREAGQRQVGPATTVPRYPMNIFFNAGRVVEQVDEYNWIYTRRQQGGSGICEDNPATTTCLATPLNTTTGYTEYIAPLETRIALGHVLANDPKPHFIHQSNLAEDRIAYPVLNGVLDGYARLFADDTPVVNLRMKDIGAELHKRSAWKSAVQAGDVTAYRIGDTVTVEAPAAVAMTATMPAGTTRGTTAFGQAYAGKVSGWVTATAQPLALTLPSSAAPGAVHDGAGTPATNETAPRARVPAGVLRQVPYSRES
ncbi:hypothetical protein [Streptomyces jumonjinensis]|uniref:Secreted protein n=1 Tax=Streptomyces jumonjinensis TaxID=1945 RepID=A0A646KP74_STRJU|nr:hypothetical protein [Streptomyces jumonjinensis]MQT04119.1 hypothetical protein [Streptomyces jumonjinensis]